MHAHRCGSLRGRVAGARRLPAPASFPCRNVSAADFHRSRAGRLAETVCAENNFAFEGDAGIAEILKVEPPNFRCTAEGDSPAKRARIVSLDCHLERPSVDSTTMKRRRHATCSNYRDARAFGLTSIVTFALLLVGM
jgi:hypothetical protein